MIRVISKQLTLALTVISFSLSPIHAFADPNESNGGGAQTFPVADPGKIETTNLPPADGGGGQPAAVGTPSVPCTSGPDCGAKLKLNSDVDIRNAAAAIKAAKADPLLVAPDYPSLMAEQEAYDKGKPTCIERHDSATTACLEHLSPNILTGITTLNTIMSTLGGAAVKDQCSGFANAMDIAKAAMTAYTAACGTMKAGCGLSCVGARKNLEKIQTAKEATCPKSTGTPADEKCADAMKEYNTNLANMKRAAKDELNAAEEKSMAGKAKLCTEKYAQLLTSGLAGIASLLNSIKQGKQCEEQSNGTNTPQVADVCSDPAKAQTEECLCKNPQSPQCICFKSPRTAGCSTGLAGVGENSAGSQVATGATDKSNVVASAGTPNLGGGDGGMQLGERNPSSADGGGIGAPTGGGAGLGGSGGGSGGGAGGRGEESAGKKGLDTNILGGTGGGGGGGSWGAYGGGSSNEKYRAYLPGGAKDPNKAAGQQAWTKEVTGQGGKSNWEKVKERYRDNKNTLLNN